MSRIRADLAAERGGNVEGVVPGEVTTTANGVILDGRINWPSLMATDASRLFARNIKALLPLLQGEDGGFAPDFYYEIIQGALLTRDGAVVHERLKC